MRVFGRAPGSLPKAGGSLARALAACLVLESEGTLSATPTSPPSHLQEKSDQPQSPSSAQADPSVPPTPTVQRGGFGNVALTSTELDEAIAGGIFMTLVGGLFWWESRPPKKKRTGGS